MTPIDTYIKDSDPRVQKYLKQLKRIIKDVLPKQVEETISYGIPTFKLNRKYVVYFGGFKEHVSIFPAPVAAFVKELKNYHTSKGTVRFSLGKPLPISLIKKMVRHMLKLHQTRTEKK